MLRESGCKMEYGKIIHGRFLSRPNRFVAMAEVNGETVKCHVKNTGRCKELLIPGAAVILHEPEGGKRTTKYDLISVYKGDALINMDSQAPNKIAAEFLRDTTENLESLKAEVTYGESRFDFLLQTAEYKMFTEVKGVTLEKDGIAMFPDAPTERGIKHVNGLIDAVNNGYRAKILFIIQMQGIKYMIPNRETHPAFAEILLKARSAGVEIRAIDCKVYEGRVEYGKEIPVILE